MSIVLKQLTKHMSKSADGPFLAVKSVSQALYSGGSFARHPLRAEPGPGWQPAGEAAGVSTGHAISGGTLLVELAEVAQVDQVVVGVVVADLNPRLLINGELLNPRLIISVQERRIEGMAMGRGRYGLVALIRAPSDPFRQIKVMVRDSVGH